MSRRTAVVGEPHRLLLVGLACTLALGLSAGCTKRGPAERAGEKIDHTVDTIKNGGHEPLGDSIKDDVNKARDKMADAADDAKDKH
jgi:hypothetical protein